MTNTKYFYNNYYDRRQRYEIRKGMDAGVDVSIYANPEFDLRRMYWIRKAIESNDNKYMKYLLNDNFDNSQVVEIIIGLECNINVDIYAKPEFNADQMKEIREGLEAGIDVSIYVNPALDADQMAEIRYGLEENR